MYQANKQDQRTLQKRNDDLRDSKQTEKSASNVNSYRTEKPNNMHLGKNMIKSPCAFHPSDKITNFCKNRECLLPLCPKCVKIHTDEHIKMGIFGEFNTIEDSLSETEEGLKYSFQKLSQLERVLIGTKQGYEQKIAFQRKSLRQAKNYLIEQLEKIFDGYEKALLNYQTTINSQFLQQLYNGETTLAHLTQHYQRCIKNLTSPQTLMEAIINYYSEAQQIQKLESYEEKLQKLFPVNLDIIYHATEIQRLQNTVRRYIDFGKINETILDIYKQLNGKIDPNQKTGRSKESFTEKKKYSPIRREQTIPNRPSPKKDKDLNYANTKNSQLGEIWSNLNLGKFNSPLDNFSLAKLRKER